MIIEISPSAVRNVWLCRDPEPRSERLLWLEQVSREKPLVPTDDQMALLERRSVGFRCRHLESNKPGGLLNQDAFY